MVPQVLFCFTQSVASTRWMLQDEMHISNTECDNCLIGTMIACQYLACLCNIAACIAGIPELDAIADVIDILAQAIWCTYVFSNSATLCLHCVSDEMGSHCFC